MLQYPGIDPVAFSIGSFSVHWYGIMYLFAFASAWGIGMYRARRPGAIINQQQVENLITYGAFGVILGGRVGFVFFYGFDRSARTARYVGAVGRAVRPINDAVHERNHGVVSQCI